MGLISIDGYEPAHLSYSTVDGYRSCGMRMKLQKVHRLEQHPNLAGLGGNALHTATEWWDLDTHPDLSPEELWVKAWELEVAGRLEQSPSYKLEDYILTGRAAAKYGGKRNLEWWADNGPLMLRRWIDWRDAAPWHLWETPDEGELAVEPELNVILPGDIPVKMYVDRYMVNHNGELAVLDIKSGRSPETAEQLGLYAVGAELTWGPEHRPTVGYYWDANKGGVSDPWDLAGYTVDYFAELYAEAIRGINAGCFLAKPQNNCRAWCGVARYCPAVGGTLTSTMEGTTDER